MYKKILVPIDPETSEMSLKAIKTAQRMANTGDAHLHLHAVIQEAGTFAASFFPKDFEVMVGKEVIQKLRDLASEASISDKDVSLHVSSGPIYHEILHQANQLDADLIVMSSHRPELSDYLLGPNAARVVRHAKCSVMVVRD